jgi:hypothetical protein
MTIGGGVRGYQQSCKTLSLCEPRHLHFFASQTLQHIRATPHRKAPKKHTINEQSSKHARQSHNILQRLSYILYKASIETRIFADHYFARYQTSVRNRPFDSSPDFFCGTFCTSSSRTEDLQSPAHHGIGVLRSLQCC